MTRIFHTLFLKKNYSMPGCDIRLVFTFPPKDSTLQYKKCVHLWNNFPCITSLAETIFIIGGCGDIDATCRMVELQPRLQIQWEMMWVHKELKISREYSAYHQRYTWSVINFKFHNNVIFRFTTYKFRLS